MDVQNKRTEDASMNQLDVAGVLRSYAERASKAENTKQLRKIIKNLKGILDLRTIRVEGIKE